jgi:hypothetical protein
MSPAEFCVAQMKKYHTGFLDGLRTYAELRDDPLDLAENTLLREAIEAAEASVAACLADPAMATLPKRPINTTHPSAN